jgi:hypothetical protein
LGLLQPNEAANQLGKFIFQKKGVISIAGRVAAHGIVFATLIDSIRAAKYLV